MALILLAIPFFFALLVIVGALFLRAAISLANKMLPPKPREPLQPQDEFPIKHTAAAPVDDTNPFAAPNFSTPMVPLSDALVPTIPEPNFGKACGIVTATAISMYIALLPVGLILQNVPGLAGFGSAVEFLLIFLVASLVYSAMLPTTFARAALVYFLGVLIMLAVVILIIAITILFNLTIG